MTSHIYNCIFSFSRMKDSEFDKASAKNGFIDSEKSFASQDHSDEDVEIWARTVDLPGFDDNVSPNNNIGMLLRFVIGKIVYLHLIKLFKFQTYRNRFFFVQQVK